MNLIKLTFAAATLVVGFAASASAMPVGKLSGADTGAKPEQVRLVCNQWGRCWHVRGYEGGYRYGYGGGYRGYRGGWNGRRHHR